MALSKNIDLIQGLHWLAAVVVTSNEHRIADRYTFQQCIDEAQTKCVVVLDGKSAPHGFQFVQAIDAAEYYIVVNLCILLHLYITLPYNN